MRAVLITTELPGAVHIHPRRFINVRKSSVSSAPSSNPRPSYGRSAEAGRGDLTARSAVSAAADAIAFSVAKGQSTVAAPAPHFATKCHHDRVLDFLVCMARNSVHVATATTGRKSGQP